MPENGASQNNLALSWLFEISEHNLWLAKYRSKVFRWQARRLDARDSTASCAALRPF